MLNKSEIEEKFDKQFGKDGEEKNCDSIGRMARCDDCSSNIKLRAEHKAFIHSIRLQDLESLREEIHGMKKPLWNDDNNRYLENVARHNLLDEILVLLTTKIDKLK